jgi:thiopeptide-type bacteriocin biosynthesis protein
MTYSIPNPIPATTWLQTSIRLTRPDAAELTWATILGPRMQSAVDEGRLQDWFIIRTRPWWRLRYTPAAGIRAAHARQHVTERLNDHKARPHFSEIIHQIYEPETTAFGGTAAMELAHRHFARDTQAITDYLALVTREPSRDRRRELSLLLCTALFQAAGLEWFEQGDVWARLSSLRGNPPSFPERTAETVRRFLTTPPERVIEHLDDRMGGGPPLHRCSPEGPRRPRTARTRAARRTGPPHPLPLEPNRTRHR